MIMAVRDVSKIDIVSSVELREGTTLDLTVKSDPWYKDVWARLNENRPAMYSLYYITFMLFLTVFYAALMPLNPFSTDPLFAVELGGGAQAYPNLRHPFGTDYIGRDVLSQLIAGSRTSMLVGIGSTVLFLLIGVPLGLTAGYYGGRVEEIIMRFADFIIALPFIIIIILAVKFLFTTQIAFFSDIPTVFIILIIIGVFGWAGTTRLVNASTKQVLNLEYIAAARTLGASNRRIIWIHIFPNILAPIIVIATLGVAFGILVEAGVTFLGFGDPTKDISWGTIIFNGVPFLNLHSQLALIPGFAVFFIAIAINLFGDAIRDALDPRLKN
jgi:ABC-type dipeptide/oligopeptide/nickel transport system permease subunit